jgi:hypothetical protein
MSVLSCVFIGVMLGVVIIGVVLIVREYVSSQSVYDELRERR